MRCFPIFGMPWKNDCCRTIHSVYVLVCRVIFYKKRCRKGQKEEIGRDVGLSIICYTFAKRERRHSFGDFHPNGRMGNRLYRRL